MVCAYNMPRVLTLAAAGHIGMGADYLAAEQAAEQSSVRVG